ncbi:hypothetical protein [Herbaspirillum sp.]|uniref:hypothetical protein n=1 Tax=Herbaspirillum sp. TaxID=1890675 RepID=UPI002582916A|nr:hypothetical protein [Herbaspirillum sp.]MCP3946330.1 hypothetical protein [Herbaspirillum sp.]
MTDYKARLASKVAADQRHEAMMDRVCARGGMTVFRVRGMSQHYKDEFIFASRDGGPRDQRKSEAGE